MKPAEDTYRVYASDKDKLAVYNHRIKLAQRKFEQWKGDAKDRDGRYRNEVKRTQITPIGHRVNVPLGVSVIDSLFSALTSVEVDVRINAVGKGTPVQAWLATEAMKYEWRKRKVVSRSEEAIKDSLIIGVGWMKVGYEYKEEVRDLPRPDADVEAEIDQIIAEAVRKKQPAPTYSDIVRNVALSAPQTIAVKDRIVIDYCPWDQVLWDPTVQRVQDIQWMCQINRLPLWKVKNDPTFRAYARRTRGGLKKLDQLRSDTRYDEHGEDRSMKQGGSVYTDMDPQGLQPDSRPSVEGEDQFVTVYEMYDFETGNVATFAKGQDFLLNETPNPFAINDDIEDRNPFVPLILRSNRGELRGLSDMEVILPSLDEANLYRTMIATYIDRIVPKLLGPSDGLTEAGKTALRSREIGAYIEYEKGSVQASDFTPLQLPPLPAKLFDMPGEIEQSVKDATGQNELLRGLFPDRRRTATETAEVVAASRARQAEKRNRLTQFYENIARRMLQLMQIFYDEERIVRIVGPRSDIEWHFTAEDIIAESEMDITLEPKEDRTAGQKRDDALALLNVAAPLAPFIDVFELARWVFTEYGLAPEIVRDLIKTPEQQQQELQAANQNAANAANAEQGIIPPAQNVPGPLSGDQLAAITNSGEVPSELVTAGASNALAGGNPFGPQAAEELSESKGLVGPEGLIPAK